jgi:thiol-disulfide isomerase/thioredoxin
MNFRVARVGLSMACALGLWGGAAHAQHDIRPWSARIDPPPVQWKDTMGRPWGREQLQGKAVVINFWATWCAPCLEELPSLQTLSDFSQGADVQVLTVNVKDPISRIQSFMARNAFTLAVVSDRQGEIAKQWGVKVFPTTVLLSPQGKPLWRVEGAVDWSGQEASSWIRRLQETQELKPSNPATPGRPRS